MNTQKVHAKQDWHPADVKAAIEKCGQSLRKLAIAHGYSHFQRVLTTPWWAAEQIVAKAIGVEAKAIWPSRYQTPRGRAQQMTRKVSVSRTGKIRVVRSRS